MNKGNRIRTGALVCIAVSTLSACDEQTATINKDSALRAAACALSPTTLYNLVALADTIEQQNQGACPGGGLILREDTATVTTITADHCVTAANTTLRGGYSSTQVNSVPEYDLNFNHISLTELDTGSQVHGLVRYLETETQQDYIQKLSFDALQLDEIESTLATSYQFSGGEHLLTQSIAHGAATIDYSTRVELCGVDAFGLDVVTTEPLQQLQSESSPSSGIVDARAADGSTLTITLQGTDLLVLLDSNGDQVNDAQLSMTWGEAGVITVASRQANKSSTRLVPSLKSQPH